MRPITTHINLMVAGASHTGKTSFIRAFSEGLGAACGTAGDQTPAGPSFAVTGADDPLTAFQLDPNAWVTKLKPIQVPEASRELVYTLQVGKDVLSHKPLVFYSSIAKASALV